MSGNDRFDEALRGAYDERDPGPAPAGLRARIAEITSSEPARRSWLGALVGGARPALAATMTLAALLLGILIVSIVRPSATAPINPGSSHPIGDPATGAGQPVDYHVAGGFVLTLPIWFVACGLVIVAIVVWFTLEPPSGRQLGVIERRVWGFGWLAHPIKRRLAMLGVALALVAACVAASGFDALERGGLFGPLPAHYMGAATDPTSGRDTVFFRGNAGPTVSFIQSIRNASSVPVTILGWGSDAPQPWIEMRIYPIEEENILGDKPDSIPFVPITLAPGDDRQILFVIHSVMDCPDSLPVASPEPTPNGGDFTVPDGGAGWSSFPTIDLRYSVLGLERTGTIEMDPVPAIWSSGTVGCGFDFDWAKPSRSPSPSNDAP